jgi:hypothetical protein
MLMMSWWRHQAKNEGIWVIVVGRLDIVPYIRTFVQYNGTFWRAWLRSDARRVREPDRQVRPQKWVDTEGTIPEGIPCLSDPMSVRSQEESYGRSRRSQKGSHVHLIPCPFVPSRNHTEGYGNPRRDPMSVRSQEESHGRSRRSQKGSHVCPIPCPSAHDSSHADF